MDRDKTNLENYIAGELRAPSFGRYLDNFEPATGRVYSQVPSSDSADLEDAVAAAKNAAAVWAKAPSDERARIMHRIADGIEARAEELAQAESRDNGKPVSLARALDIPRSSANMRFFASAATQFFSESHAMESGAIKLHPPAAHRSRGDHLSMEFAALLVHMENRAGARLRQRCHRQAL